MKRTKCKRCRVEKPLSDKGRCKGCEQYLKDYYERHKQQSIARAKRSQNKDRAKTNKYKRELNRKNPAGNKLQHIRSKAKAENIPFNLTIEDIVIPLLCPILGIPLQINDVHVGPNSISIDRIIPEFGYIKGNVAIISHRANSIKNNASIEELEKVLGWLRAQVSNEN